MSSHHRVGRAPLQLFFMGLAGIFLLVAALDVVWLHEVSAPPLLDDQGNITTRGRAWQRTDVIWGAVFIVAGVGMLGAAIVGLARGRPLAELVDAGVRLRIGGRRRPIVIPWTDVLDLRSARVPGEGRHHRPELRIEVTDPTVYPYDVWGAEWVGNVLHVDADGWAEPVEDFAVRAEIELARARRAASVAEEAPGDGVGDVPGAVEQ